MHRRERTLSMVALGGVSLDAARRHTPLLDPLDGALADQRRHIPSGLLGRLTHTPGGERAVAAVALAARSDPVNHELAVLLPPRRDPDGAGQRRSRPGRAGSRRSQSPARGACPGSANHARRQPTPDALALAQQRELAFLDSLDRARGLRPWPRSARSRVRSPPAACARARPAAARRSCAAPVRGARTRAQTLPAPRSDCADASPKQPRTSRRSTAGAPLTPAATSSRRSRPGTGDPSATGSSISTPSRATDAPPTPSALEST